MTSTIYEGLSSRIGAIPVTLKILKSAKESKDYKRAIVKRLKGREKNKKVGIKLWKKMKL